MSDPIAVVSGVNTTPALLMVHVDQLNRPVKMTNSAGTIVWNAVWQPWGGAHTLTGAEALNARFPGQWFQLEAGLHYNWHRHYDPSLGRYTQPDPLGFVDQIPGSELPGFQDGPGIYAFAGGSPQLFTDPDGQNLLTTAYRICKARPQCAAGLAALAKIASKCRCKIAKHGAHHYFENLGWCEHYDLTCFISGTKNISVRMQVALPGRCHKTRQGGEPPLTQSFPPQEGDFDLP